MLEQIIKILNENEDIQQAEKRSAYLQHRFVFAGIPKPKLKSLIQPLIKDAVQKPLDWDLVFGLWECEFRERQYVALEYLQKHRKQLQSTDLDCLKKLIMRKSWWETENTLDAFVGDLVLQEDKLVETMLKWASSDHL